MKNEMLEPSTPALANEKVTTSSKAVITVKIQLGKNRRTRRHSTVYKVWVLQAVPGSQRTFNAITITSHNIAHRPSSNTTG